MVKGGAGPRRLWRVVTWVTRGRSGRRAAAWALALASSGMSGAAPSMRATSALKRSPDSVSSSACSVQYSRAVKAAISRSRSTTSRTATDCTRPAERPPRTFRDSSGLSV